MSMSSNNCGISKVSNSRTVQRKDLILMRLKKRRKKLKSKKHLTKDYVNLLNKFWVIKLKKFKLDTD